MIARRRTVLKGAASLPALIAAASLGSREAFGAVNAANAGRIIQGTMNQLGSVMLIDTSKLNLPITAGSNTAGTAPTPTGLFFNLAYMVRHTLPPGYIGDYPIMGIYDSRGEPTFAIKMIPSLASIPGASPNNPMLQVLFTGGSQPGAPFASYVIPNWPLDTNQHVVQVAVSVLPSSPQRWLVTAIDANLSNMQVSFRPGYWTDVFGENLLPTQVPPVAFPIPLRSSGLPNDTNMVLALGQQVKDRLGGYAPPFGEVNFTATTPMDFTQFYFNAKAPPMIAVGSTIIQAMNLSGYVQNLQVSINTAMEAAQTTSEVVYAADLALTTSNIASAKTSLQQALAKAQATQTLAKNAPASVQAQVNNAVANANAALNYWTTVNFAAVQASLLAAYNYMEEALLTMKAAMAAPGSAYAQPLSNSTTPTGTVTKNSSGGTVTVTHTNNTSTVTTINGAGAPNAYSSGTVTNSTSNVISGGSQQVVAGGVDPINSIYTDQMSGQSFLTPTGQGYQPVQQAPTDPYMTIESIVITP